MLWVVGITLLCGFSLIGYFFVELFQLYREAKEE